MSTNCTLSVERMKVNRHQPVRENRAVTKITSIPKEFEVYPIVFRAILYTNTIATQMGNGFRSIADYLMNFPPLTTRTKLRLN